MKRLPIVILVLLVTAVTVLSQARGRERLSFNEGWRFQKGDPVGPDNRLSYEQIKNWLNATGNEFAVSGAKHERPTGNLGEDVAYTTRAFDDSGWRQLSVPHDW